MRWLMLVAAWALACTTAGARAAEETVVGRPIEDFSLQDFRGTHHRLSELGESKLIVVAFLGVECPLARLYAPRLAALAEEYAPRGVAVLAIDANQQDAPTELAAFARTHGLAFPLLKDPQAQVADQFGATRTPEVFVLDSRRRVAYAGRIDDQYGFQADGTQNYQLRQPRRRDLAEAIDDLLAGRAVRVPETQSVGCLIGRPLRRQGTSDVTYCRDVAPILNAHCVACHRPAQIAPFSLETYEDAIGWAEMIREVVDLGRMPPWHADPSVGHFANEARLSDAQRATIAAWVEAGAPEGNPVDLPPRPQFAAGWQIPQPDEVFYMADAPFRVPAEGVVEYQEFIVDPGWTEDRWIKAIEPQPGNPGVVHHILIFVARPESFQPELAGQLRNEFLGAFAPGFRPQVLPESWARYVPAGSKFVFQLHYTPNGSPQEDRSRLGIVLADPNTVRKEVVTQAAINVSFAIPPHAAAHRVESAYTFAYDSLLLSLMPHMHLRGKDFSFAARYPDGREELLLSVPRYDFGWQTVYQLQEPKPMPRGTKLVCTAHFDNTADNLNNPDPAATVRFGEQTWDEMMIGFFEMTLADQDLVAGRSQQVSRMETFAALYAANGVEFEADLVGAAAAMLEDQDHFERFAMIFGQVLPQLDRVCLTVLDGEQLALKFLGQRPNLRLPLMSTSTRYRAAGQTLAEAATADGLVIHRDLSATQGSLTRKMAAQGIRSSLHVPLQLGGRRGSLNLWSREAEAFPPEAVEVVRAAVSLIPALRPADPAAGSAE